MEPPSPQIQVDPNLAVQRQQAERDKIEALKMQLNKVCPSCKEHIKLNNEEKQQLDIIAKRIGKLNLLILNIRI